MKAIVAETSLETNILFLPQLLLKFSSNILQIEYQTLRSTCTHGLKEI